MPGASVRTGVPVRRAMRWTTRNENSLSSSTPATTSITSVTAEARKRHEERPPEPVDAHPPVRQAVRRKEHERVEHEDREEPEDERQRKPDRGDDRRQDRVERGDHRGDEERGPEAR